MTTGLEFIGWIALVIQLIPCVILVLMFCAGDLLERIEHRVNSWFDPRTLDQKPPSNDESPLQG